MVLNTRMRLRRPTILRLSVCLYVCTFTTGSQSCSQELKAKMGDTPQYVTVTLRDHECLLTDRTRDDQGPQKTRRTKCIAR